MRAAAAALGEAVQDVVDDPVALLLAEHDVAREAGLLGIVRQQVAQQQRRALDVAARLLEQGQQLRVGPGPAQQHSRNLSALGAPRRRRSQPLHQLPP